MQQNQKTLGGQEDSIMLIMNEHLSVQRLLNQMFTILQTTTER